MTVKIDWNSEDDIFDLIEDDNLSQIFDELREKGIEYKSQCENNEIFIVVKHNNDEELIELQEKINALIETYNNYFNYNNYFIEKTPRFCKNI